MVPPVLGKTLMARACAAQTKATFLKLAGPQLVQVELVQICYAYIARCSLVMVPSL